MKIHIAAWWHSSCGVGKSLHLRHLLKVRYPYFLESYHYMDNQKLFAAEDTNTPFFLDSGAFTAMTRNATIDINAYARFIQDQAKLISVASCLDDIGNAEGSYKNQKILESLGAKVQPVFHCREDEKWLVKYLDEGYDYIFLGGMVPETSKWLKGWLDHLWHHYLTNPDGTARVKVHGFGLTSLPLMFRYPWYSVDSTSWQNTGSFGSIFLDFPQPDGTVKDYKIDFSEQSTKKNEINSWHFDTLPAAAKKAVIERLAYLEDLRPKYDPVSESDTAVEMGCPQGFNPICLSKSYGWRWYANMEYFRRAMDRNTKVFISDQETLF